MWASGDGRPAHMLLWNAKFWYCQSLCEEGSGVPGSRSTAAEWRGKGGGGGEEGAAGRRAASLKALWGRHSDMERARRQETVAIEPGERGRAGAGDCNGGGLEEEVRPKRRREAEAQASSRYPAGPAGPAT